jgi:lipopolysaccharide transport protein LptA
MFAGFVAVGLWIAASCELSWAQTSARSNTGSVHSAHPGVKSVVKAGKSTVNTEKSAGHPGDSASGDAKNPVNDTPFASLSGSNRGPISIQSDSLALDYKQNSVLFDGHVRATQADGTLTSNTLRVKYGKDFHEVENMAANGNVRISQGVRWCTSDRAVMNQQQHTVTLTGSPVCHDAQDQIAGSRITVHLDTGKSDVEAAKAMIFPQQSKTRDNEALAQQAK